MNKNNGIRRILDILINQKILITFILIIFTLLGYMYSYHYVIPKYKSTSTLLLIPNNTSENKAITNSDLTLNSGLIDTYSNIARNSKILKKVIQNLGLNMTEEELLNEMKVTVVKDTYILEIAIINTDSQKAMEITKEIANVFLNEIKEIYHLDNIGIIDEAQLPEQPYNMNHIKDIIMFFAIGIGVSFIYVMIIYVFDNTIKKEEDIEEYLEMITLGSIPIHNNKKQEIVNKDNAKSYTTECINTIRTNILYMNSTKDAKTILITSCTPREGKSWVSANIAASFAETDKKVLLIDADMRKGRSHKIFEVENTEGLSNYLYFMIGDVEKDIELGKNYIKETQIPNLHILTNGTIPPNPSELLESNNMKELLVLLKNVYDIIIIDAPPCKPVTDSIVLATMVDSTILVANSEKTKLKDLNEVKKSIQVVGGEIIGAILNKTKVTGKTYSKSYYGYTEQKNETEIEETEIISVDELIEQAIVQIETKKFNMVVEEDKLLELERLSDEKKKEDNNHQNNIEETIQKQNYYKELDKISNQLKEVETSYEEILEKIEQIKQNDMTSEKMKEMIQEVVSHNNEKILSSIKKEEDNEQKIQSLVNEKVIEIQEEIQKLLKQEIMKINYTEQMNQINEMLTNLKDSYLELSNKIRTNDIEIEKINNNNIIDIKTLKERKKKRKSYSIEEDISYKELEKTATYIIPIKIRKVGNSLIESYESSM